MKNRNKKWLVIADYPTSRMKVGEVFQDSPDCYINPAEFPAIFQLIDEKPTPIENPDFRKLIDMAKLELEQVENKTERTMHSYFYYEQVMLAVFGEDVFKWINSKI